MGRMKEWLLAEMETQHDEPMFDYEVNFLCPVCGQPAAGYMASEEADTDLVEEIACLNPEEDRSWTVRILRSHNRTRAQLDGHPGVPVNVVPGWMPSGWDEPEPEPGAYGIFQEAMRDWKKNVVELSTMEGTGSRNRMLFVTLYSILEAYLSDTIIGSAMEDVGVQRKMLKLEGLKEKQISLETILDKPDIVREMVKMTLQGLSFHKLAQVNGMCEAAFGKPILPGDRDERALVMKSIDKRHDCVHRNGVTKEGTKHDDITSDYLLKLGALFENMGVTLDTAVSQAQAQKFVESPVDDNQGA
ncbi:hypothetical protein GOD62_28035 [Sinorhizobium medicae]|nr:hypothetical protein [Sinorhizobium medicae]MDX0796471.1 hypothetical protein [Sinorhizobium medicae]